MPFVSKLNRQFRRRKLSTQISFTYAAILFSTMILTNVGITAGVYYLFHHQAERALNISIEKTIEQAKKSNSIDENFLSFGTVMPSVVLRVVDSDGKIIVNTSPRLPETEKILQFIRTDPPFWASKNYQMIETAHSLLYYKNLPLEIGGKIYQFQFIKTITFEKEYIIYLLWILFFIGCFGIFISITSGYFLSRKVLSPLMRVTRIAQNISVGNFNRRINFDRTGDEVSELSSSFNKMLDRLQSGFTQQQKFISDASHELRTPITIISGYADVLERYGADDPEIFSEAVVSIKNSARSMQDMVENLLFLARADQGIQVLQKSPCELEEILKSAVESFDNPRIEFKNFSACEFVGDAEYLKKMFKIFIDNSLKYSEENIQVELTTSENEAEIKFIDEGIGINAEDVGKIFDRFFRADKSRTRTDEEKNSAGLSLSIAKWIADRHDIKIEVESELGKGSTFKLKIPIDSER